jgi:hypothetical protein
MTKPRPKWQKKKADAYTIARVIADQLDYEEIDIEILAVVTECLANAFTDEEHVDAYTIARVVIADQLDYEERIGIESLALVAECLADAFEFTDEERGEFVATALVNEGMDSSLGTLLDQLTPKG